jgi:hypothetical protein
MTQNVISLVIAATLHDDVFRRSNKRGIASIVGFLGVILGEFLRDDLLRVEAGGGDIRIIRVARGCVVLGYRLVFGLAVALKIFRSKRTTACVAHETPHPPLFLYIYIYFKGPLSFRRR